MSHQRVILAAMSPLRRSMATASGRQSAAASTCRTSSQSTRRASSNTKSAATAKPASARHQRGRAFTLAAPTGGRQLGGLGEPDDAPANYGDQNGSDPRVE